MKQIVILFFVIIIMISVMSCQSPINTEDEKSKIETVLDRYIFSFEQENIDIYNNILVHDEDMVNFGTSANERIVGWEVLKVAVEVQNATLSETKISQTDVDINLTDDGSFAWATSLWHFKALSKDQVIDVPIRCSWVLKKFDDNWKIVHFHKSIGALI